MMVESEEEGKAIIIEIKIAEKGVKLDKKAKEAIEQKDREYYKGVSNKIKEIRLVGMAFKGKKVRVLSEEIKI